jgi:hypothetical protein
MAERAELLVLTKAFDFIVWSCRHTGRFPRQHRFVLGERIERQLYQLLETLLQARYTKQRLPLLHATADRDWGATAVSAVMSCVPRLCGRGVPRLCQPWCLSRHG